MEKKRRKKGEEGEKQMFCQALLRVRGFTDIRGGTYNYQERKRVGRRGGKKKRGSERRPDHRPHLFTLASTSGRGLRGRKKGGRGEKRKRILMLFSYPNTSLTQRGRFQTGGKGEKRKGKNAQGRPCNPHYRRGPGERGEV